MRTLSAVLVVVFVLAGCNQVDDPPTSTEWNASLSGQAGFESVSGSASAVTEHSQTTVTITISGAPAGGIHPWHIHSGSCATDGPVVGPMDAYPNLQIDGTGSAGASATIDLALAPDAPYFVNVHNSPQDLATIVACGNLTRQGGGGHTTDPNGGGDPDY